MIIAPHRQYGQDNSDVCKYRSGLSSQPAEQAELSLPLACMLIPNT